MTPGTSIDADCWPWLSIGASAPAIAIPPLRRGYAPVHPGDRFVLLTGDCEFRFAPSMLRPRRPLLASLLAMHHGAVRESKSNVSLRREHIPWAPDSHATKAVVRYRPACAGASLITAIVEAGVAWQADERQHGRRRPLRVTASRVARAAAAAIHALQLAHPGEIAAAPNKFAAAAAAAAVTAWRYPDPVTIGVATVLAATTEKVAAHTESSPIATVVELAHHCVSEARAGRVVTTDKVRDLAAGAIDGQLAPHVFNIAQDGVINGAAVLTPDNAGCEAASALSFLWSSYRLGLTAKRAATFKNRIALSNRDENVLNDLATAATAAMIATRRGGRRGRRANEVRRATDAAGNSVSVAGGQLGTLHARVSATTQLAYTAAPILIVDDAAHRAAKLAAERAVAFMVGITVEGIRAILDGASQPRRRKEARRLLGPRRQRDGLGGRVGYSYGVDRNDFTHGYADISVVMGNCGHAHPMAIQKYEAQGWTARYNASARARHRGLQGDPNRAHPFGHIGLGWDAQRGHPYPPGAFQHRCKTCGKRFSLQG